VTNYVIVETAFPDGNYYTGYYHVRKGSLKVASGDIVKAGDQLAEVGNSGNTSAPHLHIACLKLDATGRGRLVPMSFAGRIRDASTGKSTPLIPGNGTYLS
jgi:murein DD-endopeptidase MepM/ murein hydrolase activator NlpD